MSSCFGKLFQVNPAYSQAPLPGAWTHASSQFPQDDCIGQFEFGDIVLCLSDAFSGDFVKHRRVYVLSRFGACHVYSQYLEEL